MPSASSCAPARPHCRRAERTRTHAKAKRRRRAGAQAAPPREQVAGRARTAPARASWSPTSADKTITVRIDIARRHRRYQKIVRTSSTLHAHDESNDAHDRRHRDRDRESRPLSRSKRWRAGRSGGACEVTPLRSRDSLRGCESSPGRVLSARCSAATPSRLRPCQARFSLTNRAPISRGANK